MGKQIQRKTFVVDRDVQGGLLAKAACYWLLSLTMVGALNVLGWVFIAPGVDVLVQIRQQLPSLFGTFLVALASTLIVLPVLLYDLAKHTNRFAGPVFRLQRCMKEIAEGKSVRLISFRKDDYWQELAGSFNQVVARLEAAEQRQFSDETPEFDTLVANCPEKTTTLP
jgi:signal transduction histidine kinase